MDRVAEEYGHCRACGCARQNRDLVDVCRGCLDQWKKDRNRFLHEQRRLREAVLSQEEMINSLRDRLDERDFAIESLRQRLPPEPTESGGGT